MLRLISILIILSASSLFSQTRLGIHYELYGQDGTYLGNTSSEYSLNSIYNPYGRYGSEYSSKSIMNPYGRYGSEYSNYSWTNPYTNMSPIITKNGRYIGRLGGSKYQMNSYNLNDLNDGFLLYRPNPLPVPRLGTMPTSTKTSSITPAPDKRLLVPINQEMLIINYENQIPQYAPSGFWGNFLSSFATLTRRDRERKERQEYTKQQALLELLKNLPEDIDGDALYDILVPLIGEELAAEIAITQINSLRKKRIQKARAALKAFENIQNK